MKNYNKIKIEIPKDEFFIHIMKGYMYTTNSLTTITRKTNIDEKKYKYSSCEELQNKNILTFEKI